MKYLVGFTVLLFCLHSGHCIDCTVDEELQLVPNPSTLPTLGAVVGPNVATYLQSFTVPCDGAITAISFEIASMVALTGNPEAEFSFFLGSLPTLQVSLPLAPNQGSSTTTFPVSVGVQEVSLSSQLPVSEGEIWTVRFLTSDLLTTFNLRAYGNEYNGGDAGLQAAGLVTVNVLTGNDMALTITFTAPSCVPDCSSGTCDDGCGGICPSPCCGDGICSSDECGPSPCPADCGPTVEWVDPFCRMYLPCKFRFSGFCGETDLDCIAEDGRGNVLSFEPFAVGEGGSGESIIVPHASIPSKDSFSCTCTGTTDTSIVAASNGVALKVRGDL